MARRKKTKRKTKKKIQKQTSERVVGGCFILFGILGLLNLGYLGILLANVFRIFVGDSYKVAVVLLIGYGTYLLSMGEQPIIPRKKIGGVLLAYLGVLLFLEVLLFQKLDLHANFVDITWQYLSSDIISGSVGSAVGGGIAGAVTLRRYFVGSADRLLYCCSFNFYSWLMFIVRYCVSTSL